MDLVRAFTTQVEPHVAELVQDTIDIAKNKKLKVALRLKAIDMILSRSVPTRKAIETNSAQQVNIFYMSPQEVAAATLSGTPTPLNDLAKMKRIEMDDLPRSIVEENPNEDPQESVEI